MGDPTLNRDAILDTLDNMIAVIDRTGRIIYVNRAWRDAAADSGLPVNITSLGTNYLTACRKAALSGDSDASIICEGVQRVLKGAVNHFSHDSLCQGTATPCRFTLHFSALIDQPGYFVVSHHTSSIHNETQHIETRQNDKGAFIDSTRYTQAILDNLLEGIITVDAHGIILTVNQAASDIFGYRSDEILGKNVALLMPPPHRQHHDDYLAYYRQTGEARMIGQPREVDGVRKDGSTFPISLSVSRIVHNDEPIFISLIRDITQRRRDEDEIRRLAFFDSLTGLANRRLLHDRLGQARISSSRTQHHAAVMLLDLDHFKTLNDSLGHDMGDRLLQQVAERLKGCVRETDTVARLGGDEFVILLEALSPRNKDAAAQTETIASKILRAFEQHFSLNGHNCNSTPSIGITVFIGDKDSADHLLKKADIAMYQAKAAGRNSAHFYDPALQAAIEARIQLERELREGLAHDEYRLLYQLQVNSEGVTFGAEALIRWQSERRGLVTPATFIPLSEETGLIRPLGQWVLDTACKQLVAWAADNRTAHWTLSVNISASQIAQADFVDTVAQALRNTGANPSRLKLELTESMLVRDTEDSLDKMQSICALGVSFSLDNFGTGYSSLAYLKRLPLDQLKIDQSFVHGMLENPNDARIARTMVTLGHSLGLQVIAEGVETVAQREFLLQLGCDGFQGYLFSKPVNADAVLAL